MSRTTVARTGSRTAARGALAGAVAFAAGLCAVASGCASGDITRDAMASIEATFRARGLAASAMIVPFSIDEEMRAWAADRVPAAGEPRVRLDALVSALTREDGLALEYAPDEMGTAREVFRSRRANCLAFTNLFVGMGRAMGLPVRFLQVDDVERYSKDGDLIVASGHVTAAYGDGPVRVILDFTPASDRVEYRQVHEISDVRAIALFYSNRGARALRDGDPKTALDWLRTAVQLDPSHAGGWINLGVALRRSGDEMGAEVAYRRALEEDPQASSAYLNLAALLRLRGKETEAAELLAITNRRDNRNPYNYLELGDLSMRHGRVTEAETFYRRALQLDRANPEAYAALGLVAMERHQTEEARRWLRKAQDRAAEAAVEAERRAAEALARARERGEPEPPVAAPAAQASGSRDVRLARLMRALETRVARG